MLDIGLVAGDDLDALCLLDVGTPGFLDPGMDAAHFSLAPGSPSLTAVGGSPADIFFTTSTGTFMLAVPAGALGLLFQDNVDALDCQALNDTTGPTGVEPAPQGELPEEFKLYANYPNPFNPSTVISFDLPRGGHVTLKVFNVLGKELATIVAEELPVGNHTVEWKADGFASGVYYYRLGAEGFAQTKKMLLLR